MTTSSTWPNAARGAALLLGCSALMAVQPAGAGIVTTGCAGPSSIFGVSCTLEELGHGASFQIGSFLFSDFSYVPDARGPHEIVFVPTEGPRGATFAVRRDGRVLMDAAPGGQEFLDFSFAVTALGGGSIDGMSLFGGWGYQITLPGEGGAHMELRRAGVPSMFPELSAMRLACDDCGPEAFDAGRFEFDPRPHRVDLDFHGHVFTGGSDPGATAQIGDFSIAFDGSVPLPGTPALVLAGLVAALGSRRAWRH